MTTPIDDGLLLRVSEQAPRIAFRFDATPAHYRTVHTQFTGMATVEGNLERVEASLLEDEAWEFMPHPVGEFIPRLVDPSSRRSIAPGEIVPVDAPWRVVKAYYNGEEQKDDRRNLYTFVAASAIVDGEALGNDATITKYIFTGSAQNAKLRFGEHHIILRACSPSATDMHEEIVSVTVDGSLNDREWLALWLFLGFTTGNRVSKVSVERYDSSGQFIEADHQRGSGLSIGRKAPFSWYDGRLTNAGRELLLAGFLRMVECSLPIEVIIHHITDATSSVIDTDAQSLVLAIHTAIEGWNRKFGQEKWIDEDVWEHYIANVRKHLLRPIYEDIGDEVKKNLASALAHANRTTTAWRQMQLFQALGINVEEENNKRALAMRDGLLHNGYFLKHWPDMTDDEQAKRLEDVERLRNLAHSIVFRMASYEGEFYDFVQQGAGIIHPVPLPLELSPK